MSGRSFQLRAGGVGHALEVIEHHRAGLGQPGRLRVRLDSQELELGYRLLAPGSVLLLRSEGATAVQRIESASGWQVSVQGCQVQIERARNQRGAAALEPVLPSEVTPPTPAVVVGVHVKLGDRVRRGQAVVVVSAMKLQTALVSPRDGVVTAVHVREGDQVSPGQVLVSIEERPQGGTP